MNKPNPGSDEAVELSCSCPVLDNGRGNQELGDIRGFWIDGDCPLHAGVAEEKEGEEHVQSMAFLAHKTIGS